MRLVVILALALTTGDHGFPVGRETTPSPLSSECVNQRRQGIDSAPGSIRCPGVSTIDYDIGLMAGDYCADQPPADVIRITTEDGRAFSVCVSRDGSLPEKLVVTETRGSRNFWVTASTSRDAFTLLGFGLGQRKLR